MIEVKNLFFAYKNELVLEDVSFEYNPKDMLCIIGANGGGKSTLFKLLLGLLTPKSGDIKIFGKSPKEATSLISYVPQNTNLNTAFPITVQEVVKMGRLDKKLGFYSKDDTAKALEALEKVGMSEFANKKIGELSGGQRQRVFIARALCSQSKIILLDEPTASIDVSGQKQIFELLKELNKTHGVIVVSHDINLSLGYASNILHVEKNSHMHNLTCEATKHLIRSRLNSNNHICEVEILTAQAHKNTKGYVWSRF